MRHGLVTEHQFDSADELESTLADRLCAQLKAALAERPRASLIAAGGRTPHGLYQTLSDRELDWARVDIAPSDERWVAPSHPRSNVRMIGETLLRRRAAQATLLNMTVDFSNQDQCIAQTEAAYRQLAQPFDAVILGMGGDGHIASLFPGASRLAAALDPAGTAWCAHIDAPRSAITGDETDRMTLTMSGLLSSRIIYLLIRGREKLGRYHAGCQPECDPGTLPVSALLNQRQVPVHLYWAP